MNPTNIGVFKFDGRDARFPDLSTYSWLQELYEKAFVLAANYKFHVMGPEHILHQLLEDEGFRTFLMAAGGDVNVCRNILGRSFIEHAQYSTPGPIMGMTTRLADVTAEYLTWLEVSEESSPDSALNQFYRKVISGADGSMIAECALQDCGAGSLLLDFEDMSFIDDLLHSDNADLGDEEDNITLIGAGSSPVTAYLRRSGNFPAAAALTAEVKPAEKPSSSSAEARPAQSQPAQQKSPEQNKADEAQAIVNACLRNLSAAAKEGKIDPVVGRDAEIDQMLSVLRRRRKSSMIITGEAGVGKTALAEGLAQRFVSGSVEEQLASRPLYELALQDMVAGTKYRGDFESRMQHLIKRLKAEKAIVFIDEFHMIVGSGSTYGRGMDGANMLKTALGRGEITVIGATTPSEMRELRRDAAMMRRFDVLQLREPSASEVLEILQGLAPSFLDHHGLDLVPGVLEEISRITDLYQPERHFPDKAIDLLDMSCVMAVEEAGADMPVFAPLTAHHVRAAAERLGIRRPGLPPLYRRNQLARLAGDLEVSAPGQSAAVRHIEDMAQAAAMNLKADGVRANVVIAGDGAVADGLVKGFARAMGLSVQRLDLSEIREAGQLWQLIGIPGSVGPDRTGRLVDLADGHSEMLLSIHGLERCASAVRQFLVETFKTGSFRAADGRQVSLRGAWVFAQIDHDTSALGSGMGFRKASETPETPDFSRQLGKDYLAEADAVVVLAAPGLSHVERLAQELIAELTSAVTEMGADLDIRPEIYGFLAQGSDEAGLRLSFVSNLRSPVVRLAYQGARKIQVHLKDGRIEVI